jgi:hypothetical protein
MTDPYHDTPGFFDERDVVGDASSPAGYRAFDAQFLYLRLRLDGDPVPGGTPRPSSWGFELDTDDVLSTYEVLILADGAAGLVRLFRNSTNTLANNPDDPADQPPIATYPFATHARSVAAAGSHFGNNPDFFLDMAVPWADLERVGVTTVKPVQVWAGSSSSTDSLNGDIACFDGGTGTPHLDGVPGERAGLGTGTSGGAGGNGGGGEGGALQVGRLEGGPSCACTVGRPGGGREHGWLPLAVVALVCLRSFRRGRRR